MIARIFDSEVLTLLILFALAVLAGVILGAGSKEILANLVSGLLGYLTKTAVRAYKAAVEPEPEPKPPAAEGS